MPGQLCLFSRGEHTFLWGCEGSFQVGTPKGIVPPISLKRAPPKCQLYKSIRFAAEEARIPLSCRFLGGSLAGILLTLPGYSHLRLLLRGLRTSRSQTVTFKDVFLNTEGQNLGNRKIRKQKDRLFSGPSLRTTTPRFSSLQCTFLPVFLWLLPGFTTPELWPRCHMDCRTSPQYPLPSSSFLLPAQVKVPLSKANNISE